MDRFSEIVRRGFALALLNLEQGPVDAASQEATDDWAQPVDPLVIPDAHHNSGSKGTSRVHACTGEFDLQITG